MASFCLLSFMATGERRSRPFISPLASFVVVNFLLRVLGRDATAGRPLRRWLATTSRLGRRGPRVAPVPSIWSGALPAVRRAECREGARPRVSIDTRLALGASSEAPERAGMATTISQRRPCGLGRHMPPVGTDPRCGRRGGGLRDEVLASPRHRHPTAMPHALRGAAHASRPRSARAPLDLVQGGGWLPPLD